jgi:hypothetical protein
MKLENQVMEQLLKYFKDSLDEDMVLVKPRDDDHLNYYIYSLKAHNSGGPNPRTYLHYSLEYGHW